MLDGRMCVGFDELTTPQKMENADTLSLYIYVAAAQQSRKKLFAKANAAALSDLETYRKLIMETSQGYFHDFQNVQVAAGANDFETISMTLN